MTPKRRRRAEHIFQRAADLSPDGRAALLESDCDGDDALRDEVNALLAAFDRAGSFLEPVPTPAPGPPLDHPAEGIGDRIDGCVLREQIGSGAFGDVYLADQLEPVRRTVALKLLKVGMDTRRVVARFDGERQALALLSHPSIAQVYGAGTTARGRPYFVMEHVPGVPIDRFCDRGRLDVDARLRLFLQVCAAVQHAHQRGIIHRDLKPSNVLVQPTAAGAPGLPKVIDFGIAKAVGFSLTEHTLTSERGQFIGTPGYMSPEQTSVSSDEADTRSDVYALGAILYELLAGAPPFDAEMLRTDSLPELVRRIREEEPPRPSARVGMTGGRAALRRRLAGDLDWVAMKALEKEPARRYASVSELAADVERHLRHEPVLARAPSTRYVIAKFVRRHRVVVTAALLVAASLVAGIIGTTLSALEARRQRDLAVAALARAARAESTATRRFEDVRGLARAFIFDVHDRIQELAGATEARRALVRVALQYLDQLDDEAAADRAMQHDRMVAYLRIGDAQGGHGAANLGDPAAAELSYRKALAIAEELVAGDGGDLRAHVGRANAITACADLALAGGRHELALREYERAREIVEGAPGDANAGERRRALSNCFERIGDVQMLLGRPADALESYQRDVAVQVSLADGDWRHTDGIARCMAETKVGRARAALGQQDLALASFRAAAEQARVALADDPANGLWRRNRAVALWLAADLLLARADVGAAAALLDEAADIARSLAAADPANVEAARDVAVAYFKLGGVELRSGGAEAAMSHFTSSFEIMSGLADADPRDARHPRALTTILLTIGDAHKQAGRTEAAADAYRRALPIAERLARLDERSFDGVRPRYVCLERIGELQLGAGSLNDASATFARSLALRESAARLAPDGSWAAADVVLATSAVAATYEALATQERANPAERATHLQSAKRSYQGALDAYRSLHARRAWPVEFPNESAKWVEAIERCDEALRVAPSTPATTPAQ